VPRDPHRNRIIQFTGMIIWVAVTVTCMARQCTLIRYGFIMGRQLLSWRAFGPLCESSNH